MELAELRDAGEAPELVHAPEQPPELAVVEADGGRIRTREPGQGRGVHGEAWRETKNANLLRMTHHSFAEDPEPELPAAFADPQRVAKLAEKEAPPTVPSVGGAAPASEKVWRPKRLVRTCLSSMAEADVFGQQMQREAKCRRFFEAVVARLPGRRAALELVDLEALLSRFRSHSGLHPCLELSLRCGTGAARRVLRRLGVLSADGARAAGRGGSQRPSRNCKLG